MQRILNFIYNFESDQQEIMLYLHDYICSFPGITAKIRYRIPFYYRKSWICYLNPIKDGTIELAFTRGNELSGHKKILKARGRAQVMGIIYRCPGDVDLEVLDLVLQEAFALDARVPYKSKRKKS